MLMLRWKRATLFIERSYIVVDIPGLQDQSIYDLELLA